MHEIYRQSRWFVWIMGLWILGGAAVIAFTDKEALHFALNDYHHPLLDSFFGLFTELGNGLFALLVIVALAFYKLRWSAIGAIAFLTSGVITQVLKRLVFDEAIRPFGQFSQFSELRMLPQWLTTEIYYSFPSGHATAAFAVFMILAFISHKQWVSIVCALLALSVAYSRIYLSLHFFEDVYTGSLIGFCVAWLVILIADQRWPHRGHLGLLEKIRR